MQKHRKLGGDNETYTSEDTLGEFSQKRDLFEKSSFTHANDIKFSGTHFV